MAEPIVIPTGGGEVIGDSPDRTVLVLSDRDELHATWSRFGPGREGADLHVHREHTDLFYVLEGELTIRLGIDDEPTTVPAGTLARVPPMVVHGFRNASDADVTYLNLHTPGVGFIDYMRGLRDGKPITYDQHDPPDEGVRPPSEAVIGGDELVLDDAGNREVLLCDIEALGLSEARSQPGAEAPPRHLHRRHAESFYVLEGELVLTLGDREIRTEAGAWAQVPPGIPHSFAFPANAPARYLTLPTANCGFGPFLRAAAAGADPDAVGFDQEPVR
jgi:quercetin dioxygenase-like cupin family protein